MLEVPKFFFLLELFEIAQGLFFLCGCCKWFQFCGCSHYQNFYWDYIVMAFFGFLNYQTCPCMRYNNSTSHLLCQTGNNAQLNSHLPLQMARHAALLQFVPQTAQNEQVAASFSSHQTRWNAASLKCSPWLAPFVMAMAQKEQYLTYSICFKKFFIPRNLKLHWVFHEFVLIFEFGSIFFIFLIVKW